MLTPTSAINELKSELNQTLAELVCGWTDLGRPQLVKKASEEAEKTFQSYAKARANGKDLYAAALAFLRGHAIDDEQRHTVAGALALSIQERDGAKPIGSPHLGKLLESFKSEAAAGFLWRLTWFGLLSSYFEFNPLSAPDNEKVGWQALRQSLVATWSYIDRDGGLGLVPDWLKALRENPALLTEGATDEYASEFLSGDGTRVNALSESVGIPENSWFWHALVLSSVKACTNLSDSEFVGSIPRLISLVKSRPVYRDNAIELMLERYHHLPATPAHPELRDYIVNKEVWKNPKLKSAGIATAWNRVPEAVWKMVLNWVNEGNLRDFFDVLAARNGADEGRLAFWSKYLKQISWTRLIFSTDTVELSRKHNDIRELLARESGAYATLTGNRNLDAFMMEIGPFTIVEFSLTGNAAYVYKTGTLQFERNARSFHGGTSDLRYGFHGGAECRIIHNPRVGWETNAAYELERLGIHPDKDTKGTAPALRVAPMLPPGPPLPQPLNPHQWSSAPATPPRIEHSDISFSIEDLEWQVSRFPGAYVDDRRQASLGRLWVEDPGQDISLGRILKAWGFKWANSRSAWYYVDN